MKAAHALKGPAGYAGASRLHYACYYIQKAFAEDDIQTMIEFYPLVIETAIEARIYIRKIFADLDGKFTNFEKTSLLHNAVLLISSYRSISSITNRS